jgi:hypothetical protein
MNEPTPLPAIGVSGKTVSNMVVACDCDDIAAVMNATNTAGASFMNASPDRKPRRLSTSFQRQSRASIAHFSPQRQLIYLPTGRDEMRLVTQLPSQGRITRQPSLCYKGPGFGGIRDARGLGEQGRHDHHDIGRRRQ